MSVLAKLSVSVCLLLLTYIGSAQVPVSLPSNLRVKTVSTQADSLQLDSVSILPTTFFIKNIESSFYRLDFVNAKLHWNKKPATDSVVIQYRVFPFNLTASKQRISYDSVVNFSTLNHSFLMMEPVQFKKGFSILEN